MTKPTFTRLVALAGLSVALAGCSMGSMFGGGGSSANL